MIFGPFGKAWLAIVSRLFFFAGVLSVVQGFPVEFNHSVASVGLEKRNPTAATWTSPGRFTGVRLHSSCAGKESFFEDVLNNMVTVTGSAKTSISTIEKAMSKDRKKMLPTEKSYVDLYQSLYGEFKPTDKKAVKNAKAKLKSLSSFVTKYNQGLSGNAFKLDVYCDHTQWVTDGTKDNTGDYLFKLTGEPLAIMTSNENTDICKEANGKENTLAFMTTSRRNVKDFMTVCPKAWKAWTGKTLISQKQETLKSLLTKSIDDVLDATPESLFLHELSHTESYFSAQGSLDDEELNDGDPAYEWVAINKLAKEDKDETTISKIRPLKNADTLMYMVSGLYLSEKANWGDGTCRDPKNVN
ncbi:unnamed protein product [Penicillium palitans]